MNVNVRERRKTYRINSKGMNMSNDLGRLKERPMLY